MKQTLASIMLVAILCPFIAGCQEDHDIMVKEKKLPSEFYYLDIDDYNDPPKDPGGG